MAFITADRVRDTSSTAGAGAFSVSGTAPTGYRTFSAVLSVSDTFYYSIQHQSLNEWEVGLGTYTSANTFSRTTIYSSSNSGSVVTFSAGTKDVFITMAASRSPQLDASGNVTALGTPVSATLTNATGLPLTTGVTGVLPFANGGNLAWQSVQTGSFTAVAGNAYPVNTTSGAVTVTLPASPVAGQVVQITDYAGTFNTNNLTLGRNGSNINGLAANAIISAGRSSVSVVYIDSTQGWLAYSSVAKSPFNYEATYLVVAGGAGGGGFGGGGAGGYQTSTAILVNGTSYTITVGGGGAGGAVGARGTNGNNSVFSTITSTGGGGGGATSNTLQNGLSGGSGGGAGTASTTPFATGAVGSGTSGQGNNGGLAVATGGTSAGGGGGASAVGGAGVSTAGGAGGAGSASSITGASVTYAGGGGGGGQVTKGSGGAGGGGAGAQQTGSLVAVAGTANTGGGGGGGYSASFASAAGGSGVVILSVPTGNYSGITTGSPTVTTSGSNTIMTFTASGSYTA
jgi:hypothetical protein